MHGDVQHGRDQARCQAGKQIEDELPHGLGHFLCGCDPPALERAAQGQNGGVSRQDVHPQLHGG